MLPRVQPIIPIRQKEPFDDPEWLFDLKYDGFRALCYLEQGRCRLISRNSNLISRFDGEWSALKAPQEGFRRAKNDRVTARSYDRLVLGFSGQDFGTTNAGVTARLDSRSGWTRRLMASKSAIAPRRPEARRLSVSCMAE